MRHAILGGALLCALTFHAAAGEHPVPPGLQRIMAEGAGRVANMTCADVRAVVAWIGEARAVEMAREAGATNSQIDKAKRCLKSSSR